MTSRFQLRFQDGERAGEVIPLSGGSMTVGRRPGVDIQVSDASVSGRHAELVLEGEGVLLRDLGSTNGTRVGDRRVEESQLAHGDRVRFGSVELVFEDREYAGAGEGLGSTGSSGAGQTDDQDLGRVSSAALERSGRRSRLGLLLGAAALVAGGSWWYLGRGPGGISSGGSRPVESVAGNLLERGYSFEGEAHGEQPWTEDESGPVAFLVRSGSGRSGQAGLSLEMAAGEWARHRSPARPVGGTKQLTLVAWLRGGGDQAVSLGLEFSDSGARSGVVTAWAPVEAISSRFARAVMTTTVPPGYDRVRAVLSSGAAGEDRGGEGAELEVDDVSLVGGSAGSGDPAYTGAPASPVTLAEYKLHLLGTPASSALLRKAGRTFFAGLELVGEPDEAGQTRRPLDVSPQATGITLHNGRATPALMTVRLEPGALRDSVATVATAAAQDGAAAAGGGYRTHALDFERSGVTSLLAGEGLDLVCWQFDEPVTVRGVVEDGGLRLEAQLPTGVGCLLQLSFRDERLEAGNLAHGARNAERAGGFGECLGIWKRVLDEYPFEEALVAEAERTRGRLVGAGLEEVTALERRVERARFFQLADLFRLCREDTHAIAVTYGGSEVEQVANRLTDAINGDLLLLDSERDAGERQRLGAILHVLEDRAAVGMATALRGYMDQHYGEAEE